MNMKINKQDNFKLVVLALVSIAADLVTLVSLGTINPNWRADVLFSDWMLDHEEYMDQQCDQPNNNKG